MTDSFVCDTNPRHMMKLKNKYILIKCDKMQWYHKPGFHVREQDGRISIIDVLSSLYPDSHISQRIRRALLVNSDIKQRIVYMRYHNKGRLTPFAHSDDAKRILISLLAGKRMAYCKKIEVLTKLDVNTEVMRKYVEEDIVHPILLAFAHLGPIAQYTVQNYRVDVYFPIQRLAVECDEHDHKAYDPEQQQVRQDFIQSHLNCVFFRFDPHNDDFCVFKLISKLTQILYPK